MKVQFSSTRRHMREMEQMMDSMMGDPFGMMDDFFGTGRHRNPHQMIEDGHSRRRNGGRSSAENQLANPFGGFGFGLLGNMMQQMVCENFNYTVLFTFSRRLSKTKL